MAVYGKNNLKKNQVLQEAYFGKTPEIEEAEKILGQWRSKYMGTGNRYVTAAAADPLFQEFCDKMADIFGFEEYIILLRGELMANSATPMIGQLFIGHSAKVTKTKTGYKFDGTPIMIQYCYPWMLFDPKYTDAEIMAITLHEIGHNFSHKASTAVCLQDIFYLFITMVRMIIACTTNPAEAAAAALQCTSSGRKIYSYILKSVNSSKLHAFTYSFASFLMSLPVTIMYNVFSILNVAVPPAVLVKIALENLLKNNLLVISGIKDERIADNFATIYGYGPDLYTGLRKIELNSVSSVSAIHKVPVLGWVYDLLSIPQKWVLSLADAHPTSNTRRKAQINYLEAEMKKEGIPSNARRAILSDLRQFDEDLDEIAKNASKLGGSMIWDKYAEIMNSFSRGDDPRELFFDYDNDVKRMDRLGESTSIIDDVKLI